MISDTKDTFGEMAFKAKHIENNLLPKQIQLIFTVFKKKRRVARIDERDFYFDTKTITQAERQATWVEFVQAHRATETPESCRFMLIDKRMTQILPRESASEMPSNNVLLYRSYLYTPAATSAHVIRFQATITSSFHVPMQSSEIEMALMLGLRIHLLPRIITPLALTAARTVTHKKSSFANQTRPRRWQSCESIKLAILQKK